MAQEAFIVCDNLVKIYKIADLESVALQGLDLVVAPGELLGIVGPSGSGKSTLMNILGGIDRPSAGRVWVDGQDLLKMSDAALNRYRRSKVGFVWQQGSRNLVPYLSALENVELPMTLAGQAGPPKRQRAQELLEAVGLAERRHHRLAQMSGGEQQRVAIAVALANNPILLLADEPTGEVDSVTALTIYQTFQRLNREHGLTTLIVSHDPGIARHMDRVVAIRDGKTATETVRQSVLNHAPEGNLTAEGGAEEGEVEEVFEELVVLDSAGRLQVPKEHLEHFDIKGRARLELTEEGILIRPAPQSVHAQAAETSVIDLVPGPGTRGAHGASVLSSALQAVRNRVHRYAVGLRGRIPQALTRLPFASQPKTKKPRRGILGRGRHSDGDGRKM
ncbi:MAG TPA: ABC transporter ATP-binding protein [Anaerolineae bacterium]|nr:ABC transporter ATP-binding protein [Anaerolineae bacterium]